MPRIDNTRLREAFEASGLSLSLVAIRCGWVHPCTRADRQHRGYEYDQPATQQVKRALGLLPDGKGNLQRSVNEATAKKLANALELDPVDLDF